MVTRVKLKRTLLYLGKEALIAYLLVVAGMYFLQGYMLFHPDKKVNRTPSFYHWPFEEVTLDVKGGRTNGWYIPLENARGTLLFSHGNDGNIADWLALAPQFRSLGFSVLLYDYGGFGKSTGRISEARCHADARAMWDWLTKAKGIPPERILLYGQSLGGGVTARLASEVKPGAVVLESTFTSVTDVSAKVLPFLPVRWLCSYPFDNAGRMADIHAPILVIHSPGDTLIPYEHGRKLFELANEPKSFLDIKGDHNTGFMQSKEILTEGLAKFVAPLFPSSAPLPPVP